MAEVDEMLAYYRAFRAQIIGDIEAYSSGTHFTGEIKDGNRVDTTAKTVAELKRRLADTEKIIAAYKERKGAT